MAEFLTSTRWSRLDDHSKVPAERAGILGAMLLAVAMAAAGCTQYEVGSLEPAPQPASNGDTSSDEDSPPSEPAAPDDGDDRDPQAAADDTHRASPSAQTDDAPAQLDKAEVGVGTKGKDYGGGIITEPARVFFRVEERITFQQVEHAQNLFKAEHGQFPQSHEEFMEKVIAANQIDLPGLPEGAEYWYDAESAELMIKRPGR